jgi:hypothetical protein
VTLASINVRLEISYFGGLAPATFVLENRSMGRELGVMNANQNTTVKWVESKESFQCDIFPHFVRKYRLMILLCLSMHLLVRVCPP